MRKFERACWIISFILVVGMGLGGSLLAQPFPQDTLFGSGQGIVFNGSGSVVRISANVGVLSANVGNTLSFYLDAGGKFYANAGFTSNGSMYLGSNSSIYFNNGSNTLWQLQAPTVSPYQFGIIRYDNTGTLVDTPFTINGNTGLVNVNDGLSYINGLVGDTINTTGLATLTDVKLNTDVSQNNMSGNWTPYTPTIASTVGSFTAVSGSCHYKKIGRMVDLACSITETTLGTASGQITSTLPFSSIASIYQTGIAGNINTGYQGWVSSINASSATIYGYNNSFLFTGSGQNGQFFIRYESAS